MKNTLNIILKYYTNVCSNMKRRLRNTSATPRNLTVIWKMSTDHTAKLFSNRKQQLQAVKIAIAWITSKLTRRKHNIANVVHHHQFCSLGILLHILWFQTFPTYVAWVLQKSCRKSEIVGTAVHNRLCRAENLTFPGSNEYTVAICGSNNINFNKTNYELLCVGLTLMPKLVKIIIVILDSGTIKIIQEEIR